MTRKILIGLLMITLIILIWPSGTPAESQLEAHLGAPAPDFTLTDQQGQPVHLADYNGKIVVLEWVNPDCPFVQRHYREGTMKQLAAEYGKRKVVWLAINSTHYMGADRNRDWATRYDLPYPILDDHVGQVGHMYDARTTPHMFIIDRRGHLVYHGAIDNDPSGSSAERVDYVRQTLDQLLAGQAVSVPETKSYGCSVKYAR